MTALASHTLKLSYSPELTATPTHSLTHTLTVTFPLTLFHSLTLIHSHPLSHTRTHHTHTHTHTHRLSGREERGNCTSVELLVAQMSTSAVSTTSSAHNFAHKVMSFNSETELT